MPNGRSKSTTHVPVVTLTLDRYAKEQAVIDAARWAAECWMQGGHNTNSTSAALGRLWREVQRLDAPQGAGSDDPACTCPETDPMERACRYTVAHMGAEPHAVGCPRHGMQRADEEDGR